MCFVSFSLGTSSSSVRTELSKRDDRSLEICKKFVQSRRWCFSTLRRGQVAHDAGR